MFEQFKAYRSRWGLVKALYAVTMIFMQKHLGLHVFVVNARPLDADRPRTPLAPGNEIRLLSQTELHAFAEDPRLQLRPDFIDEALARGDRCFGFLEQGELVSYCWFAMAETRMEAGLNVRIGNVRPL